MKAEFMQNWHCTHDEISCATSAGLQSLEAKIFDAPIDAVSLVAPRRRTNLAAAFLESPHIGTIAESGLRMARRRAGATSFIFGMLQNAVEDMTDAADWDRHDPNAWPPNAVFRAKIEPWDSRCPSWMPGASSIENPGGFCKKARFGRMRAPDNPAKEAPPPHLPPEPPDAPPPMEPPPAMKKHPRRHKPKGALEDEVEDDPDLPRPDLEIEEDYETLRGNRKPKQVDEPKLKEMPDTEGAENAEFLNSSDE
mmetsp:Transcript_63893/g.101282  ORF Transcript_63893/g.101282 Transcript_63893/m.101282 type:complete len:252 (-) Transcript_63893:36-791(-)